METVETGLIEIENGLDRPRSARDVQEQVNAIQQVMRQVMKDGEHYGVIPGCGKKPALFKAGAEKICFMFRLVPDVQPSDIQRRELAGSHVEYEVRCSLRTSSGALVGTGVGLCSTMESKYRYRGGSEVTSVPVPRGYWDLRKQDPKAADSSLVKALADAGHEAASATTKKDTSTNQWYIAIKIDKAENPDIADTYNTVLKMAKKRAFVDAVLTSTAASDFFTQDIEEMPREFAAPQPTVKVTAATEFEDDTPEWLETKPASPEAPAVEVADPVPSEESQAGEVCYRIEFKDVTTRNAFKAKARELGARCAWSAEQGRWITDREIAGFDAYRIGG